MANKKVATDFEKIIHEGRERKQNEALAARIFGGNRRSSAPQRGSVAGGSLASRVGVKKRVSTGPAPRANGNINGEWTHDLHEMKPSARPGSLASRMSVSGAPRGPASQLRAQRRATQVAQTMVKTELEPSQVNFVSRAQRNNISVGAARPGPGMSIRGLAGPFVVMAQNFAPGTTAADIESAMTPIGGLINSCRVIKAAPILIAEIVFESKEGADRVIAQFNNQTADGRVLHVYPKLGGGVPAPRDLVSPPTGPRASRAQTTVVDGSMGFDDPMDTDGDSGQLYSDQLVSSNNNGIQNGNHRRGRGFRRGGGNR